MLDLDRFDAWTERSNALRAGASRRIRQKMMRTVAVATLMLVMLALWPATTRVPQPAKANTTPHAFIIKKAEQVMEVVRWRSEVLRHRSDAPPPGTEGVDGEDCVMCEYLLLIYAAMCKQNPYWCTK